MNHNINIEQCLWRNNLMYFSSCKGIVYTVNQGDSLYRISKMFQVPLEYLLKANPYADILNLKIGEAICIPTKVLFYKSLQMEYEK